MLELSNYSVNSLDINCAVSEDVQFETSPILLIHGVLRRWQDFLPLLPSLTLRHSCFAIDQRGHGLSEWATGNDDSKYRTVGYVQDVKELVRSQFGQGVIIYGHSLGAMVAASVASQLPGLVQGLILEDPPFHTMGDRIESTTLASYFSGVRDALQQSDSLQDLIAKLSNTEFTNPATGEKWKMKNQRDESSIRFSAACLRQIDPQVLDPICDGTWLNNYDVEASIAGIKCPTLLLQADSESGGMLSNTDVGLFQKHLMDLTYIPFENQGHLLHWNSTQKLLNSVCGFLESF